MHNVEAMNDTQLNNVLIQSVQHVPNNDESNLDELDYSKHTKFD